jgi:hypothetical protein
LTPVADRYPVVADRQRRLVKAVKMPFRQTRRTLALAVGALVLAAPALTSCGFDYATDRVYTPGNGVNDRDAQVDVLNAVVVSGQEGSGTFVASFANNDQEKTATVQSVSGAGDDSSLKFDQSGPIQVPAGGLVNLATDGGIPVTGSFGAGDFVTVSIGFGDGESVEMDVPAVDECGPYTGLDISGKSGSESSPSASTSGSEDQCGATGAPGQE